MVGIIIFLLVSVHLAVGMLASLLLVSRNFLGEKFFRFIAVISLILLVLAQLTYRFYRARSAGAVLRGSVVYWQAHVDAAVPWLVAICVATLVYVLSLPFHRSFLSRTLLVSAVLAGGVSLALLSSGLVSRAIPSSVTHIVFSGDFLLSALVLGSVMNCMILGHWYLVQPGMSVRPLKIMAGFFLAVVSARVLLSTYTSILAWREISGRGAELLSNVVLMDLLFLLQRVLFGLVLPLALSWMIWQTVKIRSTQSATGILYVAAVFVLFGEFLSRYILVSMGYPI